MNLKKIRAGGYFLFEFKEIISHKFLCSCNKIECNLFFEYSSPETCCNLSANFLLRSGATDRIGQCQGTRRNPGTVFLAEEVFDIFEMERPETIFRIEVQKPFTEVVTKY